MDICTISKLANEAGVSVYVVRDYVLRGLLRPARRTESGYGLYDDQALERLRFVRSLFEAGVGLDELTRLCHALDDGGSDAVEFLERVRARIAVRCAALSTLDGRLERMISAVGADAARECSHA
ncbi:mercuric resistance transcriptional repressor protein MerD [Sphingopyxis sp. SE2]|uniref:mercuric resistance transcriptional repressor MerD n=1 Tax=Sphingopyxis sp. SE2 TaxID=1586240 RepID=UPI0028C03A9A|nr:mercuric resistance transcriptional repressor MerD [Sphingopyxis sp. SE2]MDT7531468.1 mercuric resistance transcriptional repressor protein MerD [Sphingopyxis sp. SE2]